MSASEPDPPVAAGRPGGGRPRLSVAAAVVLGLVVLSAAIGWGILRGQATTAETVPLHDDTVAVESGMLYVHVLGEVAHPGLYELDAGARVVDALAAAGGTTDVSDLAAVNLARVLADGEQLRVPSIDERAAEGESAPDDGLIDLNTADQTALETLPRIGPALAQRIIAWREEHGRFASVDDLLAVSGIGEKMLAGMRDLVRV